MKNLKSILLIITVMAALVSFTSCDDDEAPECVGTWEFVSAGTTYTYVVKDDGTYIYVDAAGTEIGIYDYTTNTIIFSGATSDGIATISGRAMDLNAISKPLASGIYIKK